MTDLSKMKLDPLATFPVALLGTIAVADIQRTFTLQGRPRWEASGRAIAQHGQTLRDSGDLYNSIGYLQDTPLSVIVGTNIEYAPYLHYGFNGEQKVSQHIRKNGVNVKAHTRQMNLTARPFMFISTEAEKQLKEVAVIWLQNNLKF